MSFLLKIKYKTGIHMLKDLTPESSLDDLKSTIASVTDIQPDAMKILKDYPPKPMDLSKGSSSLVDLKFKSGDVLFIEEDTNVKKMRQIASTEKVLKDYMSQMEGESIGVLVRRVVPADNSCLFTSVNFVMEDGVYDSNISTQMRELIAGMVMSDPVTYNEAVLGKSNEEYCQWIQDKDSWGGAIEVSILSKYFATEIAVVDTQYTRINKFGEDENYDKRVFLIYDGIHYDPLMMESPNPTSKPITKFSAKDSSVLKMALELAAEAKASRQFTDVHKFSLRCLVCQKALVGQTEAQSHAKETGHINFGEF